ncbi:MAG: tetratricopeptide repeat protein [Saprospiraceae bacterium]|nr:tetratricopeptide repeat protein [Saprospiraceae bacterium]
MVYHSKILEQASAAMQRGELDLAIQSILDYQNSSNYSSSLNGSDALLMGKAIFKKGRFLGDEDLIDQAGKWLEQFRSEYLENSNGAKTEFLLAEVAFKIEKKQFEAAEAILEMAYLESLEASNALDQIRVYCAKSQLEVSRNAFDKALDYAQRAKKTLYEKELDKNEFLLGEIYYQLIQIHVKRQEYGKILEDSKSLLEIAKRRKDVERELSALNNIAIYYAHKSDYKTAMRFFLDALEKSREISHRPIASQCLINIGTIYAHLDNQREAERRYLSALEEYEDVLPVNTRIIIHNNLGNAALTMEKFSEAQDSFTKAYLLAEKVNYKEMQAQAAAQLSRSHIAAKDWSKGKDFAGKAKEFLQGFGDLNGKQINLINLGAIHHYEGNFDQAIILTSQGIAASKRLRDDSSEIRGYRLLALIYRELEDYQQAYHYQTIYAQAQERYLREKRNRQVIDLEIKYAIRDKQKEIEQLTKENEFQSLLLEQSHHITNQNAQLLQVNEELRQFAYVASHDLKEPLRMIGSYVQLIQRRHKEDFGPESKEFFAFVQEGVSRMNSLLDALLRYATIGKSDDDFEPVDLTDVVDLAIINLRVSIEETGAEIEAVNLPTVRSIKSLLIQLFQNLIGNAIKFRKEDTIPVIKIIGEESPEEFVLSIQDNGIGIDPEFQEKIFVIFQRLHTRAKYQGAGIGLSICQKIIQRVGGRIWVASAAGQGATFFVAFPKVKENLD